MINHVESVLCKVSLAAANHRWPLVLCMEGVFIISSDETYLSAQQRWQDCVAYNSYCIR